eukprot:TRINITY_DN6354_c0_g1_i1.p1 TRINITY_DN6354_c0_g1~~TRINITY_DN6354_c0_g1_i1.p1  ORF type:complete len:120 (-),score=16.13 TRINITY_DN6354_c0_g1_i1:289-648(-)
MSSRLNTLLTVRLGTKLPFIQAPMAEVSLGKLAGSVARAGGLGMIGVATSKRMSPRTLTHEWGIAQELSSNGAIGYLTMNGKIPVLRLPFLSLQNQEVFGLPLETTTLLTYPKSRKMGF